MKKTELGQFYTTNYQYILSNMRIPEHVNHIIEPFVGNGDLLGFIPDHSKYMIETYDIDPKYKGAIQQDTLKTPPLYQNKFVLTNPPYLARNKSKHKELYDAYGCNDLYKCFICQLIQDECQGGIIIIPLNFISSIRKADVVLRKRFLEKYTMLRINIFEEKVFDDTGYSVCSIYFQQTEDFNQEGNVGDDSVNVSVSVCVYPSQICMEVEFTEENQYTIGGEIYQLPQNPKYKVQRATLETTEHISNILVKCIDDNIHSQLGFKVVSDEERYIDTTPNLSARSYATLVINEDLTLEEQGELVEKMNAFLKTQRDKYHSLFLTNYRESNSIARKRMSFDLAFKICNYMLSI